MHSMVNLTNGFIILSDSFATNIFKQSFHSMFAKDEQGFLKMGFNANLDIIVSIWFFSQIRLHEISRFVG